MSEAKETAAEAAATPAPGAAPEAASSGAPTSASSTAGEATPASPAPPGEATTPPPDAPGSAAENQAGSDSGTQAAPGASPEAKAAPDAASTPDAASESQAAQGASPETKAAPAAGSESPVATPAASKPQATASLSVIAGMRGMEPLPGSMQELMAAGVHFGHQTRRWNPKMKPYIFGERGGVHIIDLDHTVPMLKAAMAFLCETASQGGRILFVATKRQARTVVKREAERAGQFYVNNRWLGGMLTNFRTVRRSIERFKGELKLLGDEERISEFNKKERSRLSRSVGKYRKSLDGLKELEKLPDALFVIDLNKEHIAVSEAARLGIPVVAVVDTNCDPECVDYPVPGNDDSARAIKLYCRMAADACIQGVEMYNQHITQQSDLDEDGVRTLPSGRRVVEIQQPQAQAAPSRRERGARPWRARQAGGSFSAGGRGDEASGRQGAKGSAPQAAGASEKAPRKARAKQTKPAPDAAKGDAAGAIATPARAKQTKPAPGAAKGDAAGAIATPARAKQAKSPKPAKKTKQAPASGAAPAKTE